MPDESEYITDKFVSHNSLKAWKVEHDKQVAENVKNVKQPKPKSPKGGKTTPSTKNKSPNTDVSKKASISRPKSNESSASKERKKVSPIREGSAKTKVRH